MVVLSRKGSTHQKRVRLVARILPRVHYPHSYASVALALACASSYGLSFNTPELDASEGDV